MRSVFADTFFFLGILNRADQAHEPCRRFAAEFDGRLVTTDFVLLELADALSSVAHRLRTARFIQQLRASASLTCVPASEKLLSQALELYESRPDKEWSLTDCASFVAMRDNQLTEAATGDRHLRSGVSRRCLDKPPQKISGARGALKYRSCHGRTS